MNRNSSSTRVRKPVMFMLLIFEHCTECSAVKWSKSSTGPFSYRIHDELAAMSRLVTRYPVFGWFNLLCSIHSAKNTFHNGSSDRIRWKSSLCSSFILLTSQWSFSRLTRVFLHFHPRMPSSSRVMSFVRISTRIFTDLISFHRFLSTCISYSVLWSFLACHTSLYSSVTRSNLPVGRLYRPKMCHMVDLSPIRWNPDFSIPVRAVNSYFP